MVVLLKKKSELENWSDCAQPETTTDNPTTNQNRLPRFMLEPPERFRMNLCGRSKGQNPDE